MKGTSWNGSHFANKGTSRSEGEEMFSVGNLVAYKYSHYCSPDGRSSASGVFPTTKGYLLQEEITLEEYDNTTSDRYGSGDYDVRKVVDLPDMFWHVYYPNSYTTPKRFLLQISNSDQQNVFTNSFIFGDIAEVRNHQGKFLHIYEIPEGYRECKAESFTETVEKINLQKKQEDSFEAEKVAKRYRGVELIFGITASGWYASRASFGKHSVQLAHEYDSTSRNHYKLVIMPCVPDGSYQFYIGGTPMSLYLQDGREPSIDTLTDTHWANSQNWKYCEIQTLSIEKGWILIDGEDVYENTKKTVDELQAAQKNARKSKFEELSKAVTEKYGEEVVKTVSRKKGAVLGILKALGESQVQANIEDVLKALKLSDIPGVVGNLIALAAVGADTFHAAKIAAKARAWKYLYDNFEEVAFTGYFDEAKEALVLYAEHWAYKQTSFDGNTIGDFIKK